MLGVATGQRDWVGRIPYCSSTTHGLRVFCQVRPVHAFVHAHDLPVEF